MISRNSSSGLPQAWLGTSIVLRSWQARTASRPVGASTRTRCSRADRSGTAAPLSPSPSRDEILDVHQRLDIAQVLQTPGEDALELPQLAADEQPVVDEAKLPYVALLSVGGSLDHREGLAHFAEGLEVA